ncbi:MAG: metallophosphoesterase, partial [Halobacteriovoraceae bacterium]|nr:metallophosphoesterase [Halobacteriovoraceae bacterium]
MKASVFLSDTHIIETGDEGDKALDLFFHHERVKNASRIVLLGDIFDYASGFHRQYYQRFSTFFNGIEQCIQSGQEVYFIEGNHDVHLEKLIRSFLKRKKLDQSLYFHEQRSMVVEWYGKRIFLSHGDDIGVSNKKYQDYKNFILSKPINLISNHLFPLWLFDYLAKDASVKSRKRNSEFYNKEEIAEE